MPESLDDVGRPLPGSTPEEWLGSPDVVQRFRADLDRALERLAVELAAIRAERDGLRLQIEGVNVELELARAELAEREKFASAVRELGEIVRHLNVPTDRTPAAVTTQKEPRRRARTLALRLLVVAAVLLVTAALLISVGPKVAPYETYFVRSGSMEPTFATGDLIVLTKVRAADVRKGDIITFERPDKSGALVTHRVYRIETNPSGRQFVTKGDANPAPDAWRVPATGVSWRYKFRIPTVGYVFGYLSTPAARLALLAVPAVLLALISLIDIWKPKSDDAGNAGDEH